MKNGSGNGNKITIGGNVITLTEGFYFAALTKGRSTIYQGYRLQTNITGQTGSYPAGSLVLVGAFTACVMVLTHEEAVNRNVMRAWCIWNADGHLVTDEKYLFSTGLSPEEQYKFLQDWEDVAQRNAHDHDVAWLEKECRLAHAVHG